MSEDKHFWHGFTVYTKRNLGFVRRNTPWALLYFIHKQEFGFCQKKYALSTVVLYIQKGIWILSEEIRFRHCCTLYTKRDLDFVRRNTLWTLLYFIYKQGIGLCQKKYALDTAVLYIQTGIWTLSEEIRFGHCCTLYTNRDLDFVRRNTLWTLLYFIYKKGFGLCQKKYALDTAVLYIQKGIWFDLTNRCQVFVTLSVVFFKQF